MCVVSAVTQAGSQLPLGIWDRPSFTEFQKILDAIKKLDDKLGLKDCEDTAKAEWMKRVTERLDKLEGK